MVRCEIFAENLCATGKKIHRGTKNGNHAKHKVRILTKYASFTIIQFAIRTILRGHRYIIRILDVQN